MKKVVNILFILYEKKWIRLFVIPVFLFIFWVSFSLLFSSYTSIFTIIHNYNNNAIIQSPSGKLLKGENIIGEFKAAENNLGILSVQFVPPQQVDYEDQDVLVFRIKEKGAKTWWYQNTYKSGGIYGLPLYPFGFPVITVSKGKTFVFSLTSLYGSNTNAVQLSSENPVLISRYVFSKKDLLANKKVLIQYIVKKFFNAFTDINFLNSSVTFAFPLIIYLFWIGIVSRVRADRYTFLLIIPLLVLLLLSMKVDDTVGFFFVIIGFWIIIIRAYRIESSISFLFALLFFIFTFISILLGFQGIGGRFSNWTYVFLVIGAVQLLQEVKEPNDKRIGYTKVLNSLLPENIILKLNKLLQNEKK